MIEAAQEAERERLKSDIQRFDVAVAQVHWWGWTGGARVQLWLLGALDAHAGPACRACVQGLRAPHLALHPCLLHGLAPQYVSGIYAKRSFFAWATGFETALADIDKVPASACKLLPCSTAWCRPQACTVWVLC